MGLIQNKVTVSQPNSHVVVKNAGGLRGLTGETGPQGPQGVPGEAATVTAGTTTTLPAGSDATVQNVGSTSAAIFNFGIPKGDKGDTGESGAAATISVGSTSTLPAGSSATVTNSGTSSAAAFLKGIRAILVLQVQTVIPHRLLFQRLAIPQQSRLQTRTELQPPPFRTVQPQP